MQRASNRDDLVVCVAALRRARTVVLRVIRLRLLDGNSHKDWNTGCRRLALADGCTIKFISVAAPPESAGSYDAGLVR